MKSRLIGAGAFAGLSVGAIFYAKWWPYSHKLINTITTGLYPGKSVLGSPQHMPAPISWHGGLQFTLAYGKSVWLALAAALLIGAGVESLLPQPAFEKFISPRGFRSSLIAGALSLPCMMCTCCGAPITRAMRRRGTAPGAALSFWLGNPLLNPAVLIILALLLPWQYATARALVGLLVVFALAPALGRMAGPPVTPPLAIAERAGLSPQKPLSSSYFRTLLRLTVVLVPEYFVMVLLVGAFRGVLFPLGQSALAWGALAALVAAVLGTLLVVPTAAEVPVVIGLIAAGFSPLVAGSALVALPAISLPSMVMVGRALTWRLTIATAAMVVLAALLAGVLVAGLGAST